jgi:hypothetical protein
MLIVLWAVYECFLKYQRLWNPLHHGCRGAGWRQESRAAGLSVPIEKRAAVGVVWRRHSGAVDRNGLAVPGYQKVCPCESVEMIRFFAHEAII